MFHNNIAITTAYYKHSPRRQQIEFNQQRKEWLLGIDKNGFLVPVEFQASNILFLLWPVRNGTSKKSDKNVVGRMGSRSDAEAAMNEQHSKKDACQKTKRKTEPIE